MHLPVEFNKCGRPAESDVESFAALLSGEEECTAYAREGENSMTFQSTFVLFFCSRFDFRFLSPCANAKVINMFWRLPSHLRRQLQYISFW